MSAGVKGLRLSTGPRGSYVHAGRGGLYYRERLGGSKSRGGAVQREQIGFSRITLVVLAFACFVLIIQWLSENPKVFLASIVLAIFTAGIVLFAKLRLEKLIDTYKRLLDEGFLPSSACPQLPLLTDLRNKILSKEKLAGKVKEIEKRVYGALLDRILDDGCVTAEEKELIEKLESIALSVEEDFKSETKKEIFRLYYLDAIADHALTHEEIKTLENIGSGLNLKREAIAEELKTIHEILKMQKLSLPLPPVQNPQIKLQKTEIPHYVNNGQVLTRKKAEGRTSDYEYSVRRDGQLVITDKRIMVVGEGTTSVRLNEVIDVDADLDSKMIIISKEGSSAPTLIKCEEPLYCAKIIDLLTEGRE